MSIKISVIIPVYNAEKYITECVKSLINQTLQECEFIFINDGSKDKSSQIIECYEKMDSRIRLFNQENQGVSSARNSGLDIASGEYIGFVDADDHVELDMYERLYISAKLGDCDCVLSNFESEVEGHKVIIKYPFPFNLKLNGININQELLPYLLKSDDLNTVCNKIFKNKVIKDKKVRFPGGVALGEDSLFNILFFTNATSFKYIDYTGYHYREVAGSATRNIFEKNYFKRALEVYTLNMPEIERRIDDKENLMKLKSIKLVKSVMSYIHLYFQPSKDLGFIQRYQYIKDMISNNYVRESLPIYYSEFRNTFGRYEKWIFNMIEKKSVFGLFCLTFYSRIRNR